MTMRTCLLVSLLAAIAGGDVLPECPAGVPRAVDGSPVQNRFMTTGGHLKCSTVGGPVAIAQCLEYEVAGAGTRCCDDDDEVHDVSLENVINGSTSLCPNEACELVTFATAKARCEDVGMRLCTTVEILDEHRGEGTGCGYDHAPVWTLPANLSVASVSVVTEDGGEYQTLDVVGTVLYKSTNGIYFDPLPAGYNLEAAPAGGVSRVAFKIVDLRTNVASFGVDSTAPFRLFDVVALDLASTDYRLTVTPFNSEDLEGVPLTIEFSVVDKPFNPVEEPILLNDERGTNVMRLKRLASFPTDPDSDPRGDSLFTSRRLRINCLVPNGPFVYACMESLGIIRRVNATSGEYEDWFDVYAAIEAATDRQLSNTDTFPHSGLRALAFDADFDTSGLFYTSHLETHPADTSGLHYIGNIVEDAVGDSVVAEWQLDGTYRQLFRVSMPTFPDVAYENPIKQILMHEGHLYVAMGDGYVETVDHDGGRANDALGKILRIQPEGAADFDYSIPQNNPFIDSSEYPDEVYAVGFRNPHNFGLTDDGHIFVVDVGRDNAEEVNVLERGGDYGWNEREGPFVHQPEGGGLLLGVDIDLPADDATFGFTYPAAVFGHEGGKRGAAYRELLSQSIAGGCPLSQTSTSELAGRFFYGDFPEAGPIFYSYVDDLLAAVVTGDPADLTRAPTYLATLEYYDEDDVFVMSTIHFRDIVNYEAALKGLDEQTRNDMRFGCGPDGQLLISSKRDGNIYTVINSRP